MFGSCVSVSLFRGRGEGGEGGGRGAAGCCLCVLHLSVFAGQHVCLFA